MYTLCGSGHRPDKLGGHWNPIGFRPAIQQVQRILIDITQQHTGPVTVISGMALGFDMILAVAAIQARAAGSPIRLVAAIPFEGHHARWTDQTARRGTCRSLKTRMSSKSCVRDRMLPGSWSSATGGWSTGHSTCLPAGAERLVVLRIVLPMVAAGVHPSP